jgi:hypothetical protein
LLYTIKQILNEQLYKLHLDWATYCNVSWHNIQDNDRLKTAADGITPT